MIETLVRPYTQALVVDPLVKWMHRHTKLTPIHLTVLGGVFGIGVLWAAWHQHRLLAIGLMLLSGGCDLLDGSLARVSNTESQLGAFCDILMDRFVEICILLGVFALNPSHPWVILLMLSSVLLCVTSFLLTGLFCAHSGEKSFYYSPGLIERAEAFVFFGLMMLCSVWFVELGVLFCILVIYTTLARALRFILFQAR